jgi:hypothetical protein
VTLIDLSPRPRPPWLAIAIGWLALVLLMTTAVTVQKRVPISHSLEGSAISYGTLALLSVAMGSVNHRLAQARRPVRIAAHLAMAVAVIAVWQAVYFLHLRLSIGPRFWQFALADTWIFQLTSAVALYVALAGTIAAVQAESRAAAERQRQAELAAFARDAERSAIVNAGRIREVEAQGSSRYRVLLEDGTTLVVSRSRADVLRMRL